jgi:hypothetical protein
MQIETYISDIQFNFDGSVKQYPYRAAHVLDCFMEMSRDSDELKGLLQDLEAKLAEAAGRNPTNHCVYEVTTSSGNHLFIMFHDSDVYFGLSLEEGW